LLARGVIARLAGSSSDKNSTKTKTHCKL